MRHEAHVKDLKPLSFLSARKFGYSVGYNVSRKRIEWAAVRCKSEDDCELAIGYNVYDWETDAIKRREIVIKGTQDELAPLVYLIEYLVSTDNFYY